MSPSAYRASIGERITSASASHHVHLLNPPVSDADVPCNSLLASLNNNWPQLVGDMAQGHCTSCRRDRNTIQTCMIPNLVNLKISGTTRDEAKRQIFWESRAHRFFNHRVNQPCVATLASDGQDLNLTHSPHVAARAERRRQRNYAARHMCCPAPSVEAASPLARPLPDCEPPCANIFCPTCGPELKGRAALLRPPIRSTKMTCSGVRRPGKQLRRGALRTECRDPCVKNGHPHSEEATPGTESDERLCHRHCAMQLWKQPGRAPCLPKPSS